jgi:hypothetical protein
MVLFNFVTHEGKAMSSIKQPRWKVALWQSYNTEPAMLRVPIILLIFVFLWGVNLWLLEKARLPYHGALSLKTANLTTIFFPRHVPPHSIFFHTKLLIELDGDQKIPVQTTLTTINLSKTAMLKRIVSKLSSPAELILLTLRLLFFASRDGALAAGCCC